MFHNIGPWTEAYLSRAPCRTPSMLINVRLGRKFGKIFTLVLFTVVNSKLANVVLFTVVKSFIAEVIEKVKVIKR